MSKARQKFMRGLVRYYLALKISAMAASPAASQPDLAAESPPAVRQYIPHVHGTWDRREVIADERGAEFVIHVERNPVRPSFHSN